MHSNNMPPIKCGHWQRLLESPCYLITCNSGAVPSLGDALDITCIIETYHPDTRVYGGVLYLRLRRYTFVMFDQNKIAVPFVGPRLIELKVKARLSRRSELALQFNNCDPIRFAGDN